jgi:DNA-binding PadR family transcriptional regulator
MRHGTRHGDFERRREAGREGEPRIKADSWREQQHPHGHRGREGRGGPGRYGRGRAQRGDVRTAILLVLADQPMHGYQIMQAMGDRTGGAWRPSPGAVYPTIAQLEDEGLVTTQEEGGRRLVTLTSEGSAYLEERSARLGDPFADFAGQPSRPDLREGMQELQAAARQIVTSGSAAQIDAAAQVLAQARRSLYLILAGEPDEASD